MFPRTYEHFYFTYIRSKYLCSSLVPFRRWGLGQAEPHGSISPVKYIHLYSVMQSDRNSFCVDNFLDSLMSKASREKDKILDQI